MKQQLRSPQCLSHLTDNVLRADCRLAVTLEEVYAGADKPLEYNVNMWVSGRGIVGTAVKKVSVSLLKKPAEYFSSHHIEDDEPREPIAIYGKGHELLHNGTIIIGNLYVHVDVVEHPLYKMDTIGFANDLHATIYVTLEDFFACSNFNIPHPSGTGAPLKLRYEGGKNVEVFPNHGLRNKGTLYVHYQLVLPNTPETRESVLERITAIYCSRKRLLAFPQ